MNTTASRADACTPTTIHHPRPAIVATTEGCGNQRRFGSDMPLRISLGVDVEVLRIAYENVARLTLELGFDWRATAIVTTTELRELAARLLDAAHDIEASPATTLAGTETAEVVPQ